MAGERKEPKHLDLESRKTSFEEITKSYLPHEAIAEASRCLFCHEPPCRKGCPAGIEIEKFIKAIKTKNFRGAHKIIRKANPLGGICGRVCPTEVLCEEQCRSTDLTEPIAIKQLQRFVTDMPIPPLPLAPSTGKRVAVIGSGPAGLSSAAWLRSFGHEAVIFEAHEKAGGVMRYGIPAYRLPDNIVDIEIDYIKSLGVEIRLNTRVEGSLQEFMQKEGFDALFLALGLGKSKKTDYTEKELTGLWDFEEFLEAAKSDNKPFVGENAAVIGGGNVAIDSACTALRLGAKNVTIVYRRTANEMPAWKEEVESAQEEGIQFLFLTCPLKVIGGQDGKVMALECHKMMLGEVDSSSRPAPIPIPASEFQFYADTVIIAIGQDSPKIDDKEITLTPKGFIKVNNETMETSVAGIFAGGDAVNGGTTVVQAVAEGKKAAENIDAYFKKLSIV